MCDENKTATVVGEKKTKMGGEKYCPPPLLYIVVAGTPPLFTFLIQAKK